jgi:hypothetical protein
VAADAVAARQRRDRSRGAAVQRLGRIVGLVDLDASPSTLEPQRDPVQA